MLLTHLLTFEDQAGGAVQKQAGIGCGFPNTAKPKYKR
jgi:hypothetical protein